MNACCLCVKGWCWSWSVDMADGESSLSMTKDQPHYACEVLHSGCAKASYREKEQRNEEQREKVTERFSPREASPTTAGSDDY